MQAVMTYSRSHSTIGSLRDPLTNWLQTPAVPVANKKPQSGRHRGPAPGTVAAFVEMLWSDSVQQRSRAARQLGRLGGIAETATADLQQLILLETDEEVLREMLIALEKIARPNKPSKNGNQTGPAKKLLQAIWRALSMPAA